MVCSLKFYSLYCCCVLEQGSYLFYKVETKQKENNKQKVSEGIPSKRARKYDTSDHSTPSTLVSVSVPASAFEGEQSNHIAFNLENQYPIMMIGMSTYNKLR